MNDYRAHLKFVHSCDSNPGFKVFRILGAVVIGVVFAVVFALLFGWLVMLLWNWLMPSIFGLHTITYLQAFGITIFAKLLFSGFHGRPPHPGRMHNRMHQMWRHGPMCEEDEDTCSPPGHHFTHGDWRFYRDFWKEQGAAAFEEYLRRVRGAGENGEKT